MTQKCVHKGCEKAFEDPEETCLYHSGPPIFHEGQKGWMCCKPRVLTFDEFLTIPPCTTGKHTTIVELPLTETSPNATDASTDASTDAHASAPSLLASKPKAPDTSDSVQPTSLPRVPQRPSPSPSTPVPSESEDDPSLPIPPNVTCRRRGCDIKSTSFNPPREGETCIHHPGHAIFHEGSKGWTCCKKRVLEFDEFMKIQGCETKPRHLFVGRKKDRSKEAVIGQVRHDFYQTPTTVIASLFLKKIDRSRARVEFSSPTTVDLDLPTSDNKRYNDQIPLFGKIDTDGSSFKIMGSKLELILVKTDGAVWRTLRSDEEGTSEIIQVGRSERA